MKKILFLLLTVGAGLTACEGPMGPMGPPGEDAVKTDWWYKDCVITRDMWTLIGEPNTVGSYFQCNFQVPDLTQDIYDDGLCQVYYRYRNEMGVEEQTPLPFTEYDINIVNDVEYPFAIHYSFAVMPATSREPGLVSFKITFSDFYTGDFQPSGTFLFRLTMVY